MPADRAELLALAARAEAGGDDRLSDDVWRAAGWVERANDWIAPDKQGGRYKAFCDLVHSIDAQAELPGRVVWVMQMEPLGGGVAYWQADTESEHSGDAPTEPLARLAAKLRALAAATPEERV